MEYKIIDHIKTRASLAVLAIDDYTNRIISDGSISVSIDGAAKPVRKSEGYYVFLNLKQSMADLTIKSERYALERRSIDLDNLSKTEPVIKIRLKPGRNYSLQNGTTCLAGYAEPFSEVRVICDRLQKFYRLLYDYDCNGNKEEIYLFNPDKADMDGKLFVIKGKEDICESFSIINTINRENNLYQMDQALDSSYKKVGTKVFPVFVTITDENGEYFIPMCNLEEEAVSCTCSMLGSKEESRNITLETGKLNKLNFIEK